MVFLLHHLGSPNGSSPARGADLPLARRLRPALLYIRLRGTQDLKKKYGAEWALVTGGSRELGEPSPALAQQA